MEGPCLRLENSSHWDQQPETWKIMSGSGANVNTKMHFNVQKPSKLAQIVFINPCRKMGGVHMTVMAYQIVIDDPVRQPGYTKRKKIISTYFTN